MKKIVLFLLLGALLFLSACTAQKDVSGQNNMQRDSTVDTSVPDPNRLKANVPGEVSVMRFRPDSVKVETKDYTCFFLYDKVRLCLYVTLHRALYTDIESWLPAEVVQPKNSVLLVGTLIDPFTLITKEELASNQPLKKILELNGYKVYIITSYAHYATGVPPEILAEVQSQILVHDTSPGTPSSTYKQNTTTTKRERVYHP